MKLFTIEKILLERFKKFDELPKINNSQCDDILAQLLFYKINYYAYGISASMHNAIYEKRDVLPYLSLCLEEEISYSLEEFNISKTTPAEFTRSLFNNTQKLLTPPNEEFKEVVTMKTFPQNAIINGETKRVHFNPYLLALIISEMYFRLYTDTRIKDWCSQGHIKFESIEKIQQIIEDKYSYRFLDLLSITFNFLERFYKTDSSIQIDLMENFIGTKGTALAHGFASWSYDFHFGELINTIKGLFGKLKYS